MGRGGEHGEDCRQLPAKRGFRGGGRRCGGGKKGRICRWDHKALARDLEFGPGLRCLWVRAAWVHELGHAGGGNNARGLPQSFIDSSHDVNQVFLGDRGVPESGKIVLGYDRSSLP